MINTWPPILKYVFKPSRPFIPLVLLGVLCLLAACNRDNFSHRKYVATVNGEKIYLDDYQQRLNVQQKMLSPKIFPDSFSKRSLLEEEILESMITEKIVLQRARAINLSVSDAELERKLAEIRKDYGNNFFDLLMAQNVRYETWREELRKEMLLDKLVAVDVNAMVHVSQDEAEDYFNDHPNLCKPEAHIRAAQIVVRDPKKANEVKARLAKGEDFAKVAAEVSIGPEAVRGGDLGFVFRQTMPEPLDQTLFNLPVGKISSIVKSAYGYHVFKVTEIQPAQARTFKNCKEDVIAAVRTQKEDAAFITWLEGLKIKAVVKKEKTILRERTQK